MNVEIYGRTICPNCLKAKKLLDALGIPYTYINMEEDEGAYNKAISLGAKEVPLIFIEGNWIGGLKELQDYF